MQVADYADGCGAEEVHLIVFNRDSQVSWEDKLFEQIQPHDGKEINIWGM